MKAINSSFYSTGKTKDEALMDIVLVDSQSFPVVEEKEFI